MLREVKEIKVEPLQKQMEKTEDYIEKRKLSSQISEIQKAKTISELGLNLEEAKKILEEHDIPFVLGEEDKAITEREGGFQGLEDFILVHETRYQPTQNRIKSPKEAGARIGESITLKGKEYKYEIPYMRNTVHFAVNDEVNTSHGYMNIDGAPYAILIPMIDVPRERLKGTASDMYTFNGGAEITPQSYILCLKGEGEKVKKDNPNATVIECEGNEVNGYSRAFLSTIGYKQTDTGWYGFTEVTENGEQREKDFIRIMKENKIEIRTHRWSEENTEEIAYKFFNRAMAICHIIKENGLINSEEDSTKILKDVLERNPLEYRIESKEVIEYIKNKMEEEGLDPTSIVDRKAISSNEIIQQAVQKIVREKNNDGIKQIKDDFDKWAEERKAQEGNISLEEIYNKYEQHIKLFPTNGNIFADVATELIKHTKEKNPEEAKKMGEEILVFALNERIKTDKEDVLKLNEKERQERRDKQKRIREIWDKVGKEIGLPEMMFYEGELRNAWGGGNWPKVTTKGVEVLPPPPSKEEIIKLSKMPPPPPAPPPPPVAPPPPAPMINISDVKGAIGEVRKGEVVKARETLERTTNKEKSTEEREI